MLIPKILHQVWLGNEGILPPTFQHYQNTWRLHHPGFSLILWTEANIYNLVYFEKKYFDLLSNYSEKSDYLRFCIILQYGGIYIDTDFECAKNIQDLINDCSFFIGYDLPDEFGKKFTNSALFGASRQHFLVQEIFFSFPQRIELSLKTDFNSVMKLGPGFITPVIEKFSNNPDISLFEPYLFYPDNDGSIPSDSYARHHYSFSWLPWYKKPLHILYKNKKLRKYYFILRSIYRFLKTFIK